jgi:uncharacterized protein YkwD
MWKVFIRRVISGACLLGLLWVGWGPAARVSAQEPTEAEPPANGPYKVYLPLTLKDYSPVHPFVTEVMSLTNQERANVGCPAITLNSKLLNAAQGHSQDMAVSNFFNHTNLQGQGPGQRISVAGYLASTWAENIAAGYGTPSAVMSAWMSSSGHRANILNCGLREIGVGYHFQSTDQANVLLPNGTFGGPYYTYWTQVFGSQ